MKKPCPCLINVKEIQELAASLKIIAEPNRLKILCLLYGGQRCVCELEAALDLKQNLVSHHLKVLKDRGLITAKKKGQWQHYSLQRKKIAKYQKLLHQLFN